MPEVSPETADLLFLGLDHGIASVRDGGPLIPFVITDRNGERALARFVAETLEARVAAAVESIKANPAERSVLVYDGYLTLPNGDRFDAVYAEAVDAAGIVTVMAQRYKPKRMLEGSKPLATRRYYPAVKASSERTLGDRCGGRQ